VIYADYNGSSRPHPEVIKYLESRLGGGPFANPNAIHSLGSQILAGISKCRRMNAQILGARPEQIFFNSGASEGISTVFHSLLLDKKKGKDTIIISPIEHSAVVNAAKFYEKHGYTLEYVDVTSDGEVDLNSLKKLIKKYNSRIALVSIMAANNETGVIQPYKEIAKICNENEAPYFSDTTQYIGKADFNFEESGMDFAVYSSHKVGGIIGSGALIIKDPTNFTPIIFGGGQEGGIRGGTQNYIGIESMTVALQQFNECKSRLGECEKKRTQFERKIKEKYPEVVIIGENAPRLACTTMIAYPGIHGQGVQIELESQDIFVTTSSACSDNEPTTSKVLKAMGVQDDIGRGVVRISLCLGQKEDAYDVIADALSNAYDKLVKIKSY
jgi:cysteine desulfurase